MMVRCLRWCSAGAGAQKESKQLAGDPLVSSNAQALSPAHLFVVPAPLKVTTTPLPCTSRPTLPNTAPPHRLHAPPHTVSLNGSHHHRPGFGVSGCRCETLIFAVINALRCLRACFDASLVHKSESPHTHLHCPRCCCCWCCGCRRPGAELPPHYVHCRPPRAVGWP